jgi:prepilin-type N-terminal cleavage/methylation domain-containing protein
MVISGQRQRSPGRLAFTLVELLVAMAILALLMTVVLRFLSEAQSAWNLSGSSARIYENAQVAMELITRDLQSAVACGSEGQEVPFRIWSPDPDVWLDGTAPLADRRLLSFVAHTDTNDGADADLCEVRYELYTGDDGNADHVKQRYYFRRTRDCNRNSSGNVNPDWDFFGDTTGAWAETTGNTAHRVVSGVEALTFTCYGDSGAIAVPAGGTNLTSLPRAILITLTLFDENLRDGPAELRDKTRRTFTKLVFLHVRS